MPTIADSQKVCEHNDNPPKCSELESTPDPEPEPPTEPISDDGTEQPTEDSNSGTKQPIEDSNGDTEQPTEDSSSGTEQPTEISNDNSGQIIENNDDDLKSIVRLLYQDSVIEIYTFNDESIKQNIAKYDESEIVRMNDQDDIIKIYTLNGDLINQFNTPLDNDNAKCVEIRTFAPEGTQLDVFLALPEDDIGSLPCKYEEPEEDTSQDEDTDKPSVISDDDQKVDTTETDSTSTDSVEEPEIIDNDSTQDTITTDEQSSDNITLLPPVTQPSTTGNINTIGNFGGITVTDAVFEAGASVSNLILGGNNINKGLISNANILPDSTLTCKEDGKLTGTIENQGTISDCNFVGSELNGGYLAGTITVIDDTGLGILNNVTILPNANIVNGILSGNIDNQGIVSDVIISSDGIVIGGTVQGAIENNGILQNIIIAVDSYIEGGKLTGIIIGNSDLPLITNSYIYDADLSNILIGAGNTFGENVTFGTGVKFADNSLIPENADLSLSLLKEFSKDDSAINLNDDVVPDNILNPEKQQPTLLKQINSLPQLQDGNWQLEQNSAGYLKIEVDGVLFVLETVQVTQVSSKQPAGFKLDSTENVTFTTGYGREIFAQPVIQDQKALLKELSELFDEVIALPDGTFKVRNKDGEWITYRVGLSSELVADDSDLGLLDNADGSKRLVFTDKSGNKRQQTISPITVPPPSDCEVSPRVKSGKVSKGKAKKITHNDGAELDVNNEAVDKDTTLCIKSLYSLELQPLDQGMKNVTKGPNGFKFLPKGQQFKKKIKVVIPYDPDLLPVGSTAQDIYSLYFDTLRNQWIKLERFKVDTKKQVIISYTTHFTDMINSTITVPESPQAANNVPTQISGIKAADPGTGINLCSIPKASNMGDVRISCPIEVPPGRVGVQPQLGMQYSSSGGNGWAGLGWDLSTQAITIDTRWGVPHYYPYLESEPYLFNGQQLVSIEGSSTYLPYREQQKTRGSEKRFYPRIEGAFAKIIRHGSSPKNYWWEVTDKNGTKSFYGGNPNDGVVADAVLKDGKGNIFKWALTKTIDTNGNNIRYRYEISPYNGVPQGYDLYLKTINYTGYQNQDGPYKVEFIRAGGRPDVISSGRGGFMQVTAERLVKAKITYNDQLVRSYTFDYQTGFAGKSLLAAMSQLGDDDSLFYTHNFKYYNDVAGGLFGSSQSWGTGNDISSLFGQLEPSAINGNKSDTAGGHIYIGINLLLPKKKMSIGAKVGYSRTRSEGLLVQLDINGDGLPDKVYKKGSSVYYRANRSGANGTSSNFGPPVRIGNLSQISKGSSNMKSFGAEMFMGASVGVNMAKTSTKTTVFFTEVNSDGLPDISINGQIFFNHLDENGNSYFSPNNADTIYPIGPGAVDTTNLVVNREKLREEFINDFPNLDTLRSWTAPFDGQVEVIGEVALIENTSLERQNYDSADGVRVAIEFTHFDYGIVMLDENSEEIETEKPFEHTELWATLIDADDYTPKTPANVAALDVKKGDIIYFRVQSLFDGSFDQVSWSPAIKYLDVEPVLDANGLDGYSYDATNDFVVSGYQGTSANMSIDGMLKVTGELQKLAKTTDDVTLLLLQDDEIIYEQTLTHDQIGSITIDKEFPVLKEDKIAARVKIDSSIDLSKLQWNQPLQIFYTSSTDADIILDDQGNPMSRFDLFYNYDFYPESDLEKPLEAFIAPATGTYTANSLVAVNLSPKDEEPVIEEKKADTEEENSDTETPIIPEEEEEKPQFITLTVKRPGELLGKYTIEVSEDGSVENGKITFDAEEGDELFFEFSAIDPDFAKQITQVDVGLTTPSGSAAPEAALYKVGERLLIAPPYRGWSIFGYDGNLERADKPLEITYEDLTGENLVKGFADDQDLTELQDKVDGMETMIGDASAELKEQIENSQNGEDTENEIPESFDESKLPEMPEMPPLKVIPYYPMKQRWQSPDNEAWVQAEKMSSSRRGLDKFDVPDPNSFSGARSIIKRSDSKQNSVMLGGGPASGSLGMSTGSGYAEFMDMNGDRFPDILTSCIQYTNMLGGLEAGCLAGHGGKIRSNKGFSLSIGGGGNYPLNRITGSGKAGPTSAQMPTLGLSVNGSISDTKIKYDFADVNGDGLPDRVDGNLNVSLNVGYGFLPAQNWGGAAISDNQGFSLSLGGSAGMNSGEFGIAGGISLSYSASQGKKMLMDINGDGIPDNLSGNRVNFNTGKGFGGGGGSTGKKVTNADISMGGGLYFTIPIPIGLPPMPTGLYIIINPGFNVSKTISRQEVTFSDVNGDGNPDRIESKDDGSMKVALSNIRRTNMLQTVERPLGAKITVDYARTGNTFEQPQNRWVMSKLTVDDGHKGDGVDTQTSTYSYTDGAGKAHGIHNRVERDFYGFKQLVESHLDAKGQVYRTITRDFLNDSYYNKGLLVKETTRDKQGNTYLESENDYFLRNVQTGSEFGELNHPTATVFQELRRTDKRFFEGQATAGKATYTSFTYDDLGNIIYFFDAADVGAEDDIEADISYFIDTTNYIFKPQTIVVKNNGTVMRRREANIESGTGNMKQVRIYLEDGQAVVTDLDYDQYGNIKKLTGPANYKGQRYSLAYTYDNEVFTHNTSVTDSFGYVSKGDYDLKFGKVINTTDINNNPIDTIYDQFGRVKEIIGPYQTGSGLYTIQFEYHPNASTPWALTMHLDFYRDVNDPIETVLFTDGLKRVIQTKKDAAIHNGGSGNATDKMTVSGHTKFDFLGRTIAQYYPIVEPLGKQGVFNSGIDAIQKTAMVYDVMDRNVKTTIPDGTSTQTNYGFGSDRDNKLQFWTKVTDANGIFKETFKDLRGVITAVKEYNEGETIWTSYQYDAMKQITLVKDDKGNETKVTYDNLGRRLSIYNPDTGLVETVYDLASNVIKKVTPNMLRGLDRLLDMMAENGSIKPDNGAILYDYDYNRLNSITYPHYYDDKGEEVFPAIDVTYTYGEPGADDNRANRIVQITDQSGTEELFYGKLGETVKTIKTVTSDTQGNSVDSPEVYITEYVYDTWNRLQKLVYPDGVNDDRETLTNHYDSGGLLQAITGLKRGHDYNYINRLEYDKFGQRAFVEFGNGVRTNYSYNPLNRRLANLQAGKGRLFQDLVYEYDPVGNILGQSNLAKVNSPSQLGGATEFTYKYDDLYRLTSSTGSFDYQPRKQDSFTLEMGYDSIHNIVSKNQRHITIRPSSGIKELEGTTYNWQYRYEGSQPHAPTYIGNQADDKEESRIFKHDANGNQFRWDSVDENLEIQKKWRQLIWDDENRIQKIIDNSREFTYKYNAAGERVFKVGPQGETVYVNQFFVIRNGSVASKHVFAGSARVVSKLAKQETVKEKGNKGNGKAPRERQLYFYHPDHLGSSAYVTDYRGDVYQHLEYFPFGEGFVEQSSNTQRTPYRFTGKELDEETGLKPFGARTYDPRTSVWLSVDPILDDYLNGKESMGGIFNSFNLGLYTYGHLNPLKFLDPDGNRNISVDQKIQELKNELKAYQKLRNANIQMQSTGGFNSNGYRSSNANSAGCTDKNVRSCTSLRGIKQETVDGIISLRKDYIEYEFTEVTETYSDGNRVNSCRIIGCKVDSYREGFKGEIKITGGSEKHSDGPNSHYNGYKIDLAGKNTHPELTKYVKENSYKTETRLHNGKRETGYRVNGIDGVFWNEGDHLDYSVNE
ncbi:SpvB/TcaC N-terminal domain-containing protein [Candidatus Halobeggiatoa sp. HSG11]|nr:SpvB/TcaC N-terminal domain-containing protein [Candidatus Halobeggiatoa sp. HSG11]